MTKHFSLLFAALDVESAPAVCLCSSVGEHRTQKNISTNSVDTHTMRA